MFGEKEIQILTDDKYKGLHMFIYNRRGWEKETRKKEKKWNNK